MSGSLVGVMFEVLAAEMADPDRFRRGRAYARREAVIDVEIEPGLARAEIQGSRAQPYVVTVRVRPVRRAAEAAAAAGRLNALVPRADDLTISCTCPDWGAPCKHGVAALVGLGRAFAADPDALARWRRSEGPDAEGDDDDHSDDDQRTDGDGALDDWLGRGYDPAPPSPLPPLAAPLRTGSHDDDTAALVAAAVDDARATMARAFGRR